MPGGSGVPAATNKPPPPNDADSSAAVGNHRWSRGHWVMLIACYVCYMTKSFGDSAFDVTGPARQASLLAGSDAATATVLSVGTGCYVAGKLLLGQLGDVIGGQALYAGTLGVAGLAFAGLSVSTRLSHVVASWGLARFVLAGPWSGMFKVLTPDWFTQANGLGTVVALLGTSARFGALVSNAILGPMLASMPWPRLIQIAAAVYGASTITVITLCGKPKRKAADATLAAPSRVAQPQPTAPAKKKEEKKAKKIASMGDLMHVFVGSPRTLLAFGIATFLNPLFNFQSVLPLYLTQGVGMTGSAAAAMASAFPMGAMSSILGYGLVWDKLAGKGRWMLCASSIMVSIITSGLFAKSLIRSQRMIFASLFAMSAGFSSTWYIVGPEFVQVRRLVFVCVVGRFSIARWRDSSAADACHAATRRQRQVFGGNRSGTLTSWLDAPGYFLSTFFFATYPRVLARGGWSAIWLQLAAYAMAGLACLSGFYYLECKERTTQPHPLLRG
jgi:sugar phosphate permease